MITNAHPGNGTASMREPFPSTIELQKMKKSLSEVYELLEEYGPSWYPDRLRKEIQSILQANSK